MGPTELGFKQQRNRRRSCGGEEGRQFVNVVLADNSSPSVRDVWRSPKVELLATEQKVSVQWINRDRIYLPAAHIIQQKVSRIRKKAVYSFLLTIQLDVQNQPEDLCDVN